MNVCTNICFTYARIHQNIHTCIYIYVYMCKNIHGVPGGSVVNNPIGLPMQEKGVQSLGGDDLLEKEMATYSSILAWEIPRTEKPGGLQCMELQRVRHDLATKQQYISTHTHTHTHTHTVLSHFCCVRPFATPWTVVHQAPVSMGFSKQDYWSGLYTYIRLSFLKSSNFSKS